jgi:chemotaxis protein MotB
MADDAAPAAECPKCEECVPGLPGWMGTFSDLVTLLLTFFVLLLSFAKTESAKYEAALGSIRNAFGGNVLQHGEVIQRGKSPDNSPTMLDSPEPIKPFPIDFLTTEGMLDKKEVNNSSSEDAKQMKSDLYKHELSDNAIVERTAEGVRVTIKDKILFNEGTTASDNNKMAIQVFTRLANLLATEDWKVFVQGHSSAGEKGKSGRSTYELSAARAMEVSKSLIKRGVSPEKITTVFYGDSRPIQIPGKSKAVNAKESRRVEFILRKVDLNAPGFKVDEK